MLALMRSVGQVTSIGNEIIVTLVAVKGSRCRLGFNVQRRRRGGRKRWCSDYHAKPRLWVIVHTVPVVIAYWVDALAADGENPPMARYCFPAFVSSSTPRYVVVWDLHWALIACQRLEASADLSEAMEAALERLAVDGWRAEATPEFGFVFLERESERRLLMLTAQDPRSTRLQSFNPFRL